MYHFPKLPMTSFFQRPTSFPSPTISCVEVHQWIRFSALPGRQGILQGLEGPPSGAWNRPFDHTEAGKVEPSLITKQLLVRETQFTICKCDLLFTHSAEPFPPKKQNNQLLRFPAAQPSTAGRSHPNPRKARLRAAACSGRKRKAAKRSWASESCSCWSFSSWAFGARALRRGRGTEQKWPLGLFWQELAG